MSRNELGKGLENQYARCFIMLDEAIAKISDHTWRGSNGFRPSGVILHALETMDFYFSDVAVDTFDWGYRFNADWEGAADEELPSKEQLSVYKNEIVEKVIVWLDSNDLLHKEEQYPWAGQNRFERCLYVLRHTQHNIGQLSGFLQHTGQEGLQWQ